MSTSRTRRGAGRQRCDWPARKMSWEERDRQGCQCLTQCQCPPNQGMQVTASSVRSCLAPTAGDAEASRRQAAGAASCLAFPRRYRLCNRGWVTPRPAYRAIVPFVFDTGPRSGLCYAALPLDTGRACQPTIRHRLPGKRSVWGQARRPWRWRGRDGLRRSPRARASRCRTGGARLTLPGIGAKSLVKRDETVGCGRRGLEPGRASTGPATRGRDGQGRHGTVRSGARRRRACNRMCSAPRAV
jgi:hypothetical protein